MAKAKMIEVGNGYSVQFLQRAPGEETPYFHATIRKDGKEVGWAKNNGRGGSTCIRGELIEEDFKALVFEAAKVAGINPEDSLLKYEPEGVVLSFALCKGYDRGCGQISLNEFVTAYAR